MQDREDTEPKARKPREYSQALGFTVSGVTSHSSIGLTILFLCISFQVVTVFFNTITVR